MKLIKLLFLFSLSGYALADNAEVIENRTEACTKLFSLIHENAYPFLVKFNDTNNEAPLKISSLLSLSPKICTKGPAICNREFALDLAKNSKNATLSMDGIAPDKWNLDLKKIKNETIFGNDYSNSEEAQFATYYLKKINNFAIEKCGAPQGIFNKENTSGMMMLPSPGYEKCLRNFFIKDLIEYYNFDDVVMDKLIITKNKKDFGLVCLNGFTSKDFITVIKDLFYKTKEYDKFINDSSRTSFKEGVPSIDVKSESSSLGKSK